MLPLTEELENYLSCHMDEEHDVLKELYRETHLSIVHPQMLSGPLQGKILEMFSKMIRPLNILEIGTLTGYSAICLAQGLREGGMLHTIEKNDELSDIIYKYIEKAGLKNKITLLTGDALTIIPSLSVEFDLVFIDGDKDEYPDYYHAVFKKVKPGGFIIADNVLWSGKIMEETKNNDHFTKGILAFNDLVKQDLRVEKIILPVRDGLMLIRKRIFG